MEDGWLRPGLWVLDARYPESVLARAAAGRGCRYVPGEEWLLHQALPAYRLFTGREAPASEMAEALDKAVKPDRKKKGLALVGFMGCGKTDVGRRLAGRLGFHFVDLDRRVEEREGRGVGALFESRGETGFRAAEKAALAGLLPGREVVLACGGGALLAEENRRTLADNFLVVWLEAGLAACLERIAPGSRPLLEEGGNDGRGEKLMAARRPGYALTADLVVDAEGSLEETAEVILEEARPVLEA